MVAIMNDTQPFLKELLVKREKVSKLESSKIDEETPPKRDVKLVGLSNSQRDLKFVSLDKSQSLPFSETVRDDLFNTKKEDSDELKHVERSNESVWLSEGDSSSSIFSTSKLYGRDKEEAILAEAYKRVTQRKAPRSSEYVLISGACGTGKTSLGESLRRRVNSAGGFFCSGKFDQQQTDPFTPLCAAFNDLVTQILAREEDVIREMRQRIHSVVERDLCAVMAMIPSLRDLMCGEPADKDGSLGDCSHCTEKKGRSTFAMLKLMRSICSPERPVVMMLDDLQWASKSPLEKLRAMVLDDMNDGIIFLGISRDDVSPKSDLSTFLRHLEDERVSITNIPLKNLELETVVEMVNDVFLMSHEPSKSLARFVFERSAGNALFAVESLHMMQQEPRFLQYDEKTSTWTCDQLCAQCPISLMKRMLSAIPSEVQKVCMVASCLGSNITERLVQVALQEPVEERFQKIVDHRDLVYNERSKTYSFRVNAFQTACYDLISEEIRPAYHLEIGLRLWNHLEGKELDKNLFVVVSQLKRGASLIREQTMRYDVAALFIRAAEKAAASFYFPAASDYLNLAFTLLGPNHWEEAYDLSLALYNYAAEVEFSLADNDRVDFLLTEILDHAREFSDKIRAYSTQVYVLGVRGEMDRAIATGICVLKKLGVHLPTRCHKPNLIWAMSRVDRKLRGKSDQSMKRLPHMTDPNKLAAMQILNLLFLSTYLSRRDMFPFVVLKMMKLTLVDGMSAISSVAFAGYGALLCFAGQVNDGLRYGKLALDLVDDFGVKSFQSRCGAFVWGCIFVHARPFVESLDQLKEGHRLGLQVGDTEFAMLNAHMHILFLVECGEFPIQDILSRASEVKELTELYGHAEQLGFLNTLMAGLAMFIDPNANLRDDSDGMDNGLQLAIDKRNYFAVGIIYTTQLFICVVAGDYESGLEMVDSRLTWFSRMDGSIHETLCFFLEGLAAFGAARDAKHAQQKKKLMKRARYAMRLLKRLAKLNPSSCLAKFILLEAEDAALAKKHSLAKEKYSHAIALAAKYGSRYELAFSNQFAGVHCITDLNDTERGIHYFREACEAYKEWGAWAAVNHLKTREVELEKTQNTKDRA